MDNRFNPQITAHSVLAELRNKRVADRCRYVPESLVRFLDCDESAARFLYVLVDESKRLMDLIPDEFHGALWLLRSDEELQARSGLHTEQMNSYRAILSQCGLLQFLTCDAPNEYVYSVDLDKLEGLIAKEMSGDVGTLEQPTKRMVH